jgi:hypothetical protein
MNAAWWIDQVAEEHRQAGSRKPYTNAELDLYEMLYGGWDKDLDVGEPPDLGTFRKTIKKARLQGRRDLKQQQKHAAAWEAALRKRDAAATAKGRAHK